MAKKRSRRPPETRVDALKEQWEKVLRRHPPPEGEHAAHAVVELSAQEYDFLMTCAAGYLAMREMGESYASQLIHKGVIIDEELRGIYGDLADGVLAGQSNDEEP